MVPVVQQAAVTPLIFTRAADWAHARPFGCPVGVDLRRVLTDLTGPPRMGACGLDAPVPLPAAWPPGHPVREVGVQWPATTPALDVVVFVHPGPVPPRVRSRLLAGPALFVHVPDLGAESARRVAAALTPDRLVAVRSRLLAGELRALAARRPDLAAQLHPIAALATDPAPRSARVAVIGPDGERRAAVTRRLVEALPAVEVVGHGDVEAVVAVAPERGWSTADASTLADAVRRVGRLVSTAPLPAGVDGHCAPGDGLPEVLAAMLARPRAVELPDPRPGAWWRAAEHLERRRRRDFETQLQETVDLAAEDGPAALARLRRLARSRGAGVELPGRLVLLEPLAQAVLMAGVVAVAVGRAGWLAGPVVGVVAALVAGAVVGWLRWRQARRRRWAEWIGRQAARLRREQLRAVAGPQLWLRRNLAQVRD